MPKRKIEHEKDGKKHKADCPRDAKKWLSWQATFGKFKNTVMMADRERALKAR